jgi:phage tail protein X
MRAGKGLARRLKVVVHDLEVSGPDIKATPSAPHAVYLRSAAD